jgi:hypothetical protein
MTTHHGREATLESSVAIDQPAAAVAELLLDWGHDDLWRSHVRGMTCAPRGRAHPGQRIVEELRFAGLRFTTPTVVETAGPDGATYAGGNGRVSVRGSRLVVAEGPHRCRVHVVTRLRLHGWLRLLAPALVPAYRRTQDADLDRLVWWVATLRGPATQGVSS